MRTKLIPLLSCLLFACSPAPETKPQALPGSPDSQDKTPSTLSTQDQLSPTANQEKMGKPVIYQVFTRLFGNKNTTNLPWGTIEENGVGKFNDFSDEALKGIKALGVSHIWYTGILHHAVINDYSDIGISNDDPDVVKGRAGSPYAVKDYYQVNPDLAVNPEQRMSEFEALIARTHKHGMKVIIDIVPNHVARNYQSVNNPKGVVDFGAYDDSSVEYAKNNNFYYVVDQPFKVPEPLDNYRPLGGTHHVEADGQFYESPAKWTGNGSRLAQPHFHDWYETVKINYGVKPDGSYDFATLPVEYATQDALAHALFWQDKDVPDSWKKFKDIVYFWLDKGVDGFRYDMAEMVPVEFWSYLNSAIKSKQAQTLILAEVYNPALYRDYISLGKMDYLYDKVEMYDTLKLIMQGKAPTDALVPIQESMQDIEHHMLHFLENHDEQRIASKAFAGNANIAKPAMVISALISSSPTLLYFGQDVGEPGDGDAGFGQSTRTTIFDYWGVPHHQRWMNNGKFDGGQLSEDEAQLRDFYQRLMNLSATNQAMHGKYYQLHSFNKKHTKDYNGQIFAFSRFNESEQLLIVSNFSAQNEQNVTLQLPTELLNQWSLGNGEYQLNDLLYQKQNVLKVDKSIGSVSLKLAPLESVVYQLKNNSN